MRDGNTMSWREAAAIIAAVVGVFGVIALVVYVGDKDRDVEMAFLLKTGFSLSDTVPSVGKVESVSIAPIETKGFRFFTRTVPQDWKRRKVAGGIEGRAKLFIVSPGGGLFVINYFYSPETNEFRVVSIEDSQGNQKAAEPGATDNPDDAQRLREDH